MRRSEIRQLIKEELAQELTKITITPDLEEEFDEFFDEFNLKPINKIINDRKYDPNVIEPRIHKSEITYTFPNRDVVTALNDYTEFPYQLN